VTGEKAISVNLLCDNLHNNVSDAILNLIKTR
jgi:hypothetical protein